MWDNIGWYKYVLIPVFLIHRKEVLNMAEKELEVYGKHMEP